MTEEKLMALLKDMSLKEKIGQMMQLDVSCFKNEGPPAEKMYGETAPSYSGGVYGGHH